MRWSFRSLLSRFDRRPVDPDERSPQLGLRYEDLLLMEAIFEQDSDVAAPRHVIHYLYLPTPATARAAQDELVGAGWEAELREPLPEYPDQWTVVAEQHGVVLTPDVVRDTTDLMEAIALRGGGEHDGWEASA